jgi:hypothetical protein
MGGEAEMLSLRTACLGMLLVTAILQSAWAQTVADNTGAVSVQIAVQGAAPQSQIAQAIRNCGIPPSDIAPPCNFGGVNVFHDPGCGPTNCAAHFHGECTPFACLPGGARLSSCGCVPGD